jgi:WD40 repeat protein
MSQSTAFFFRSDGLAQVWDATSPYLRWNSPPVSDACGISTSLEPDRRFIAVGCGRHNTRVWDTLHDQLLAELPSITSVDGDKASVFPAVSAIGDRAAIAHGNAVEIYEVPGGRLLRAIHHPAAVNTVAFANAGHDLVSGAVDGSLLVTRGDRDPIALPTSPDGIDVAGFLADGRVVAAAGKRLRVYDADRNTVLADIEAPTRAMVAEVPRWAPLDHYPELHRHAGTTGVVGPRTLPDRHPTRGACGPGVLVAGM